MSRTYEEYLGDMSDLLIAKGLTSDQVYDYMNYWNSKGCLFDNWQNHLSPSECIDDLRDLANKISWFK